MTRRLQILSLAVLGATVSSAWASGPSGHDVARFAIVIGNNQAPHPDNPTLRYADDDAIATHQLLEQAGVTSRLLARLDDDSSDRDSHEWERFQAGVFSHEVRSGLRGGADTDRNGVVSYAELGAFLTTANKAIQNPRFRPDFVVRPPGAPPGDLSRGLLAWNRSQASIHVDSSALGHFYVETPRGTRVVDLHAADDAQLDLYLPTERPLYVRSHDEKRELELSQSEVALLSELPVAAPLVAHRGALHLAFSKLFQYPFGDGEVEAYRWEFAHPPPSPRVSTAQMPADLTSTVPPSKARTRLSAAMGWAAVGIAGVGLAANVWAYKERRDGEALPHVNRVETNDTIHTLNIVAVTSYSVAAAAAALGSA